MNTDILVIGGGLAGLTAANEILEANSDRRLVILQPGAGSSPYVHGFNMPIGEGDSVELFIEDTIKSGRGQGSPELIKTLCSESLSLLPLFEKLGIAFNRNEDGSYQQLRPLGASVPRVVSVGNIAGTVIMQKLRERICSHSSASIVKNLRAMKLLLNDEGTVCGALCFDTEKKLWMELNASTVILAAGGFCNIYPMSTNSSDLGGSSIAMAYEAGAVLTDMEFIQFEPSTAVWPEALIGKSVITTMFYEGAVMRNGLGERFMLKYSEKGECVDKDEMSKRIAEEIRAGRACEHQGIYFDATGVGKERLEKAYHAYVDRYRRVGVDISETPMEIAPAPHTSLGGVAARSDCSGNVKGLFVCGESLGGLHGANRVGGNAGLETMVFGRIAGKSAESYAKTAPKPDHSEKPAICDSEASVDVDAVRGELGRLLNIGVGVIRDGEGLARAEQGLCELLSCMPADELSYSMQKCRQDTVAAYLTVLSAVERKSSIGCHVRSDSCAENEKCRVNIQKKQSKPFVFRAEV